MASLDDKTKNAVIHFHEYGHKNERPVEKVLPIPKWKESVIKQPKTQTWDQEIPKDEMPKLLLGYIATCMEEKWNVYTEANEDGSHSIHMLRSWTSRTIIIARFFIDGESARFVDIKWEAESDLTFDDAVKTAKSVCSWVLHAQLP